jgi:predicted CXXCH cytochrome family protein
MLWLVWIALTITAGTYAFAIIFYGGNRSFLLIGKTTSGHHQIELACDACHTSLFGGGEVLQEACIHCHGAALKLANDSHPKSKFTDPRNADRTAQLDARFCTTCHQEHRPAITRAMGVTVPDDFCVKCHHDIADDRPSHKGLAFNTCGSAGCHNFHDNRALYQDFLLKHAHEPDQLEIQRVALTDFLRKRDGSIARRPALTIADADAPAGYRTDHTVLEAWANDAHARAGINCSDCHTTKSEPSRWLEAPGMEICKGCHTAEAKTFVEGKHGMRLRDDLVASREGPFGLFRERKLAAMTPAEARLPMRTDHHDTALGCNTCHAAHRYDLNVAKVEACTGCHDDPHTRAYFASPHYTLFRKELTGALPAGSGVSCATCHMPAVETRDEDGRKIIVATHNQNANLRPSEKMVRGVCSNCHGLQFTLDSLADPDLVERNFDGRPAVHIESIGWALKRAKERGAAAR